MTSSSKLISVVMATFLDAPLDQLQEAVDSILVQTYAHFELIIIADGPISEEAEVYLADKEREDPRVRRVSLKANAGPAKARNEGIAVARGEYIAILDADDVAEPTRLERQLVYLETQNADLCGSWFSTMNEAGHITGEKQVPVSAEQVRRWMFMFNPIANSTVLTKARLLRKHPYPVEYRYGEDYDLWVTLALEGYRLVNQPECLVRFRVGDSFVARRRGFTPLRRDFQTKLRTLRLYPVWARPMAFIGISATTLLRLMPYPVLQLAYRARNALRFTG